MRGRLPEQILDRQQQHAYHLSLLIILESWKLLHPSTEAEEDNGVFPSRESDSSMGAPSVSHGGMSRLEEAGHAGFAGQGRIASEISMGTPCACCLNLGMQR